MTPEPALPQRAAQTEAVRQAEIVIGIPAGSGGAEIELAVKAALELGRLYPSHSAALLLLVQNSRGEIEARPAAAAAASGSVAPSLTQALPALLRAAKERDAPLCALVAPEKHDESVDWLRLLVSPILEDGYDLVCPGYVRGKLEGTLTTGIVYPLTRALYGKRLRQPLGTELALSRRFVEALLEEDWPDDALHGGEATLVTRALGRGFRVCQSFLGRAPDRPAEAPADVSAALTRLVGPVFREMERQAPVWQRITGSEPAKTFGSAEVLENKVSEETVSRMVNAFELGYQDLRQIWSAALPPATLLGLKRITKQAAPLFRMDDALWARVVYDFALGHHMRLIERAQLLRSMTPLYLGWLAGFMNEVRDLTGPATEERVERLCRSFEETKPYLISRWRWPDRFNP